MNINICLMVAGIILLDAVTFAEGQGCSSYELITDSRRTTKQVFNGEVDSPISDTDINPSKWYRFRSYVGNSIPERAENDSVELNRCGTTYPMFISGLNQHPTQDDETTTATVKVTDWEGQITIYQCPPDEEGESFYIYSLVPAPADQTAYCAGEGQPCPDGDMYNGIDCVDYFPIMKGPPIFSGPHTTGSYEEQQLYFTCHVQYDRIPDDTFARFLITFIFDGLELEDIGAPFNRLSSFVIGPEGDISVNLTEYYLQGRLGKEIHCEVRSFWEENSEKGLAMASVEKYTATLRAVEIFEFNLTRGAKQIIPFSSTLPFTYYHCSTHDYCPSPFMYYFTLKTDVAIDTAANIDCTLSWKNGSDPQLTIYIKPFSGSRIFDISFEPYSGDFYQDSSSLWHNFIIPTVTIQVFQSSDQLCQSVTDPHITTFDERYFHAYESDDYYLVLVEEADQYELEIQVRQEKCNGNVACNCGVIVRELNSVVKVSYVECNQSTSTTERPIEVTRLLAQYPDDGTNITRDEDGRKYSVRLPSGTRVEISATHPYFNIYVYLAPIYHRRTSLRSMCGDDNGNLTNDLTNSSVFKISDPANNYFLTLPECYAYGNHIPAVTTCECSKTGSSSYTKCTNVEQNVTMKSPANIELTTMWSSGKICYVPGSLYLDKQSSGENDADYILDPEDLFPPFVHDPNAGHNLTLKWPTPKNKTEEEVQQYCLDLLINNPVYSECSTVANTDLTILQCVSDVQMADEYITTTSYSDSFGQECVNVLIEQENNATSGGPPPTIDISNVYNKICPAQCSGQGTCVNATCTCNTGFIGADCSIDETKPPVLSGIARSGVCDIQERPCATVSVFGSGFVSSQTLKCRFSAMDGGSAFDSIGTLVTSSEVSCPVPNIATERPAITRQGISITNDGTMYGNIQEFVTFDSVCMSCGKDKVCTKKTDSCLISDRCYSNGAMKDAQTCLQCNPSQSDSSWTNMPVTENLQPCSRTCDYGAQLKESVCTINNTVINTEPVLCQTSSCAAIPEESLQGVIMTLSNEDTTKILLTPTDILSQVADVVNNYCSTHATQCCNSVGVPNGISLSSFTSVELCPYGSGYPEVGDASSRIKVIVKMIPSQVQNECVQSAPQRSADGEEAYADPDIIVTAVTEGKSIIEEALNITITSVEKDNGTNNMGAGLPVAKPTLILLTAVTAFAYTKLS